MSLNTYAPQNMSATGTSALPGLPTRLTPVGGIIPYINPWVRNPDWLTLSPNPTSSDVMSIGLVRINPESNFLAVNCAGSLGYCAFWGDSNVSCTFQDSGDTVTKVAHGLNNNDKIMFNIITTTTGISINTIYFVVNKATDTFQISLTSGGSALPLTTDGSGYLNIPEFVATGVQRNHQYDNTTFDTSSLTSGYVTFTDSGDTVTKVAHGRIDGGTIIFYSIISTTGISINTIYYVVNATSDTFQISTTLGGSAATLITDGSGTLLNYKQAILVIVPQNTGTLTSVNFSVKHTQTLLSTYINPILDLVISGSVLTTITLNGTITQGLMVRCSILSSAITTCASMFLNCSALTQIDTIVSTGTVTSCASMFSGCSSLNRIGSISIGNSFTTCASMFLSCVNLQNAPVLDTTSVTTMANMFQSCSSLTYVPLYNTALVTDMSLMFQSCLILTTIPQFNTKSVTTMSSMFRQVNISTIPLLNTASVTAMDSMFRTCPSLTTIPLLNTASVTNMSSMFNACTSLTTIPLLNTASVTAMDSMFASCTLLTIIPLLNTASVTAMDSMFATCPSLTTIPLLNTASVTNMSTMFNASGMYKCPVFNTVSVTNMSSMFNACKYLEEAPFFNTASVTNMSSMFNACTKLTTLPKYNTSVLTTSIDNLPSGITIIPAWNYSAIITSVTFSSLTSLSIINITGLTKTITVSGDNLSFTSINTLLDNLGISSAQTITLTNNWGSQTAISTSSVTSVAGTKVLTMASTTGLVVGMEMTGTGVANVAQAVTFTDVGDLVKWTAHGIPNDTKVAFATIVTTTGIVVKTIYFVINSNANDFQVSLTSGGAAIALTTNGSGTILYPNTIQSIVANVSVTMNVKSYASATNTMTSTVIRRSSGTMKGWTVTT